MVQIVLQDHGRGHGVDVRLAERRVRRPCARTIASASRVESRSSHSVTGRPTTRSATRAKSRARRAWRPSDPSAFSGSPITSSVTPSRFAHLNQRVEHRRQAAVRDPALSMARPAFASRRSAPRRRVARRRRCPALDPRHHCAGYLGPWTLTSITKRARRPRRRHVDAGRLGQSAQTREIGSRVLSRVPESARA